MFSRLLLVLVAQVSARNLSGALLAEGEHAGSVGRDFAVDPETYSLSTGALFFERGKTEVPLGRSVAVFSQVDSTTEASLQAALSTCHGRTYFLPPASYLLHARGASCALRLPGLQSVAPLPPSLVLDPSLPRPALRGRSLEGEIIVEGTVLRVVALSLVEGADMHALHFALLPLLPRHCALVTLHATEAHISCLQLCSLGCTLHSPAACGCTLPLSAVHAAAQHPDVLLVAPVHPPRALNAFGLGVMHTSDLGNFAGITAEYGPCPDATCNQAPNLPFSQLAATFGPMGSGAPTTTTTATAATATATATACSATCASAACGHGFGGCGGLTTPLKSGAPGGTPVLTGAGELLQVVDTGLDTAHPFFRDSALPSGVANVSTPGGFLTALSSHRKVAAYWSYADGIEGVAGPPGGGARGHGTHTAGSAAGAPQVNVGPTGLLPEHAPLLTAFSGGAPGARILVTDIGCDSPGGCDWAPPASLVPPRAAPCGFGALCPPGGAGGLGGLFSPAASVGALVTLNAWGSGAASAYGPSALALDKYAAANPDHLLIFAAGDSGGKAFTLTEQAMAKNVLSVGGLADGLLGHAAKAVGGAAAAAARGGASGSSAAPLFGALDARACSAIIAATPLSPAACSTPAARAASCFDLMLIAQNATQPTYGYPSSPLPDDAFGPYQSAYAIGVQVAPGQGQPSQAEVALCCGCTLRDVLAPCVSGGGTCPDGTLLSDRLQGLVKVYNARIPGPFTAKGPDGSPAQLGRIKVRGVCVCVCVCGMITCGLLGFFFSLSLFGLCALVRVA